MLVKVSKEVTFSPTLTKPTPHRVTEVLEYVKDPLSSGLKDRSAYVRKTAVMGILKLFYSAPEFVKGRK